MDLDDPLDPVLDRLTGQARRALVAAFRKALDNQDDYVGTEHVLFGLLQETHTNAVALCRLLDIEPERLQRQITQLLQGQSRGIVETHPPLTPGARRALLSAAKEADLRRQANVGPEHLLIGLSREEESLARFLLEEAEVDADALRAALPRLLPSENRDELVQAPIRGETFARADPSLAELRGLMSATVAVPSAAGLSAHDTAEDASEANGLSADYESLRRQVAAMQILFGVFMGTVTGAAWGTWKMVLCMIAGGVIGAVRSSLLGGVCGAGAGFSLASVLCPVLQPEGLLIILMMILAGTFLGDWPRRVLYGWSSEEP